jgi:hypothetical protein
MALLVLYRGRTRVCNLLDSTFNTNSPLKASKTPRISNILGLARLGLIPVLIVLIPYDSGINPDQYPKLGIIAKPGKEHNGMQWQDLFWILNRSASHWIFVTEYSSLLVPGGRWSGSSGRISR